MKKKSFRLHRNPLGRAGFSIVEIIVAAAIFVLFVSSSAMLLFSGEDVGKINTDVQKATLYAQEGLEVARVIRDNDWEFLTQGDHGFSTATGEWLFEGTSDVLEGRYRRNITIVDVNEDKKEITSLVRWFNASGIEKEVELRTQLTNWQRFSEEVPDNIDLGDSARGVHVSGNYAYLAVDDSHKSLVIVDISVPESSQIIYTLDLNGKGRDVWVEGNYAYIILDTNRMKVIDVSDPESPEEVASVNLSAQPMAVYVYGGYVYIGQNKSNEGLVIYNISNPETPYYYRSYQFGSGEVYDVKAVNGRVYVAVNAGRGFDVIDAGNYAYAVIAIDVDNSGFQTYYLWGSYISPLTAIDVGSSCNGAFYYNDKAYVACEDMEGGLKEIDVTSMYDPEFLQSYDVDGEGNGVVSDGDYAYVAVENIDGGLSIVSLNK